MIRIGVDVGGTFTDVTALDTEAETFHILKLPTTADDQSSAVTRGIEQTLHELGRRTQDVTYLGHGTTVATNAVLERRGARTALIATQGFADILEIARQRRPHLYDLFADKPAVLVPRSRVIEVAERVTADGSVRLALHEAEVQRVIAMVDRLDVDAVTICLLHAYRRPDHEAHLEHAIRTAFPDLYVCRSSDVAPEFREYERVSTTVVNSFVGPKMSSYIRHLADRVQDAGVPVPPKVIQSNGGLVSPEGAAERPVTTLISGPSAGVIGAVHVAAAAGIDNLITFDMGGTSTDVCLIQGGQAVTTNQREVGGYPVRVPSVSVHTIGAGGGSIAMVDDAGALRVGPKSAGSQPGPAAYGRGGTQPTTTDANIVRGRQNPKSALGGRMDIDHAAAEAAVAELGQRLQMPTLEAARGIGRLANSHMARAVRKVSVESGEDPREYTLMAYGGAGPLHAAEVAAEVGIQRVLVPPHPGTLCALGLLVSDVRTEFVRSFLRTAQDSELDALNADLSELVDRAHAWLEDEAAIAQSQEVYASADVRYPRQNFELRIPLPALQLDRESLEELVSAFHTAHEKSYGFSHPEAAVQVVNVRVTAHGHVRKYPLPQVEIGAATPDDTAIVDHRPVDFGEANGLVDTPIFSRERLLAGNRISGPAVVEQVDTTTVIPPGAHAQVDRFGNLLIEIGHA